MIHKKSLKVQLSAVFLSLLSLLVFLGLFSLSELGEVNRVSVDIRDHWLQSTRILGDLNNYTSDYRAAEASHVLATTADAMAQTEREIAELDAQVVLAQKNYEQIPQDESESRLYVRFSAQWRNYKALAGRVVELSRSANKAAASTLYLGESRITYAKASDTLGELTSRTVADAGNANSLAATTHTYARALIIAAIVLASLSMIGVLQYINRSISRPLLDLAGKMRSLAANNMDVEIRGTERNDEIGAMARAVVVFRKNAIELAHSQRGLIQQATMLEEKLQYEQKLATLQRNFVAMASHEFRTPLTIIDGHAQRLIKMKEVLQPDQILERAEKVRSAVLRMTSVMDNLLTSSRLFDGDAGLYFHPAEFDLHNMLREVCYLHREITPGVQIFENYGALPQAFFGDAHLLFQAFSNLLSNAVKYSPDGGLIVFRVGEDAGKIVFSIRDNGIGIPKDDLGRLFERYHRGSNISGIAGTGIGLYLVRMVVSLHSGHVAVTSVEGQGSEFVISLPMQATSNKHGSARENGGTEVPPSFKV